MTREAATGGATWAPELLRRFAASDEVEIETRRASGEQQLTIIWIVADDRDAYVRSVRGEGGWWFRHLQRRPEGAIVLDGERVPVRAVPAADEETIEKVSELIRAKYGPRYRGDTEAMLQPETLPTTLRLLPA